jgi:2-keto-4-pentenoate hydratase/2-oxohepta-3-ene-1,7-dioic acid hydratase in catechol pathway
LGIKLWVNDVLKQDSHTGKMIFSVAEQIAHLSTRITLYPGDLILTGTPAGVGLARQEFLKAGDVVRLWIERIGTPRTLCLTEIMGHDGASLVNENDPSCSDKLRLARLVWVRRLRA